MPSEIKMFYSFLYSKELVLLAIFVAEQVLRLWSCSVHGHQYEGRIGKLRFLATPHMIIGNILSRV